MRVENYKRKVYVCRSVVHPYLEHCIVHILSSQKCHIAEKEKNIQEKPMNSQRQGTASIQAVTWWAVHVYWGSTAKFW